MLKAGYLEDWQYHQTLSGCPQGAVVSPILSNIYLDRLDKFAETVLIPEYTRGAVRVINPEYGKATRATGKAFRCGDRAAVRQLRAQRRGTPRGDPRDPRYRRLRYIRYADLCRARHKSAYADSRVMPTELLEGLPGGQVVVLGAA
jgi:retron-type reverse transcriptase